MTLTRQSTNSSINTNQNNTQTPNQNKRKRNNEMANTEYAQSPKTLRIDSKLSARRHLSGVHFKVLFHENEITKNSPNPKIVPKTKTKTINNPNPKNHITSYFVAHKWCQDKPTENQ